VVGNDDPTGGTVRSDESSVADDVISAANTADVQVSLLSDANENIDSEAQNPMNRVAEETGGNSLKYSTVTDLTDQIADGVSNQGDKVCKNQEYVFGETEGSEDRGLKDGIEMSFPVTIRRSATYSTPATMFLRLRDGPMERLIGAANRLVKRGREQGEQVSGAIWLTVEQEMYGEMREFERPVKTRYRLTTGSGDPTISADEDLRVGVNGVPKFTDLNNAQSTIDFGQQENQFTGYRGATFQVIAINQEHPSMGIDSLQVECVDQACDGPQTILDDPISASEGSQEYQDRGELGVFYHNYTTLNIGGTETPDEAAICTRTSGDDNCGILRAESIEEFTLSPGRQLVEVAYDPNTDTVIIGG